MFKGTDKLIHVVQYCINILRMMRLFVFLYGFLVILGHHQAYSTSYHMETQHRSSEVLEERDQKRWIRSTLGIWPSAIRALLQKTRQLQSDVFGYQRFMKIGTKKEAERDYLSLEATYPEGKTFSYLGEVDGVMVRLDPGSRTSGLSPMIKITEPMSGTKLKIVYFNKRITIPKF